MELASDSRIARAAPALVYDSLAAQLSALGRHTVLCNLPSISCEWSMMRPPCFGPSAESSAPKPRRLRTGLSCGCQRVTSKDWRLDWATRTSGSGEMASRAFSLVARIWPFLMRYYSAQLSCLGLSLRPSKTSFGRSVSSFTRQQMARSSSTSRRPNGRWNCQRMAIERLPAPQTLRILCNSTFGVRRLASQITRQTDP